MNVDNTKKFIVLNPIKLVNGVVDLPGSKSISNRALLLSAQAIGTTSLINLLESDDVYHMICALRKLGVNIRFLENKKICEVDGIGNTLYTKSKYLTLFLGNSGISMRLLSAALCLGDNEIILTGDSRMKERPIKHLVDALCMGGAHIDYLENDGYPPLKIRGGYCGGNVFIKGNISSQFLSGILMMAPLSCNDTYVYVDGTLVSKPYIDITLSLMKDFGIHIEHQNYHTFYCPGGRAYKSPGSYLIEGDASSASYFLAAAAIRGGTVRVNGVGKNSVQGDIRCAEVLKKMGSIIHWGNNYISCTKGTLHSIDMDMNNIPDAAMTIAVAALFAHDKQPTILRNIYNWRIKESDRLMGMATELRKVGAIITEGDDYIKIIPPNKIQSSEIYTYNDHRMAMSLSLLSLSNAVITILNPECVNKTFPLFFKKLFQISMFM